MKLALARLPAMRDRWFDLQGHATVFGHEVSCARGSAALSATLRTVRVIVELQQ